MLIPAKKLVVTGTTKHDVLVSAGLRPNGKLSYKSAHLSYIPANKENYYAFVNFEKRNTKVRVSHKYNQESNELIKQRELISPAYWVGYVYFFEKYELDNQYDIELIQGDRTFKIRVKVAISLRSFSKLSGDIK
jgi:hypothetical protein